MTENSKRKATEDTEDLSFLSETQVIANLTEPAPENNTSGKVQDPQATAVYEAMMDPYATGSIKKDEVIREEEREEAHPLREILLFVRDIAVCLAIVLLLVNFVIRPIQVKGSSMYPTLSNGELGVSNLLGYRMDGIKRFDIAIIYIEEKDEYLVKRVVGLPGETISYKDGTLYVNGSAIEEDFLETEYSSTYSGEFMADVEEITIPEDHYYCLGDNRPLSKDSRSDDYGPFPKDRIISKGVFIIWPFNKIGAQSW